MKFYTDLVDGPHRNMTLASYSLIMEGVNIGTATLMRLDFVLPPYEIGEYRFDRVLIRDREKRSKGYGTWLMRLVCADADFYKVNLVLEASPYERIGKNNERLVKFYQNVGFELIGADRTMRRVPR